MKIDSLRLRNFNTIILRKKKPKTGGQEPKIHANSKDSC